MDPISQYMMEDSRAKARQQALKEKIDKMSSNSAVRKRRSPLKENNVAYVADDTDDCSKRQCKNSLDEPTTKVSKNPKDDDDDMPKKGNCGRSRFAALAANINQWEVEENNQPSYKNNFNSDKVAQNVKKFDNSNVFRSEKPVQKSGEVVRSPPRETKRPVVSKSPLKCTTSSENSQPDGVDVKKKICVWDKAVVATLEAQGFTRSPSASKISYDYPPNKNKPHEKIIRHEFKETKVSTKVVVEQKVEPCQEQVEVSVSDKISMFNKPQKRKSVEPSAMTLSARVALFESAMDKPRGRPAYKTVPEKKAAKVPSIPKPPPPQSPVKSSPVNSLRKVLSPSKTSASQLTKNVHQNLFQQISNKWQNNEISSKMKSERELELEKLRNRWKRPDESDGDGSASVDSTENEEPEQEDVLLEKFDDSVEDTSQGEENTTQFNSTLDSIAEEEDEDRQYSYISDDVAEACGDIDKVLSEALNEEICDVNNRAEDEEEIEVFTEPGHLYPSLVSMKSKMASPTPVPIQEAATENLPLMHTVSFYRRQNETMKTPVRKLVRNEILSPPSPSEHINKKKASMQQQIKELQKVINLQQTIISQASQALNLCRATAEFYGSSEQIEGERLLLIATQRRQACLNQITRLKTESAMMEIERHSDINESEGVLTISDIRLPLKKAFVVATAEGKNDSYVHNFLCLIRQGAQIIATEMISTQQGALSSGSLTFNNMITIHNLESNFNVCFEVYGLQCPKEIMPHDRKYHIKKDSSKLKLTPKKKQDMKLLTSPAISSPGGPLAVRTSSFAIIGYAKLSLNNLSRKVFALDKVPSTSPLEGNVYLKVQCHADLTVDQRGFLTMFEDVSGFGAWHRRWCVLTGQHVAFWKYPDDEKRKEPIGYVDLRRCITKTVGTAPREICARLNTMLMVTLKPISVEDEDDLITQKYDTVTTTKHLLSADSKEEKMIWCDKINQALTNIRKWDAQALRPSEQT